MRIYDNGIIRDMTQDEIAALTQNNTQQPTPDQTPEERIAALEDELAATKILLGLEE